MIKGVRLDSLNYEPQIPAYMSRLELAEYLYVDYSTLHRWERKGVGPRRLKVEGRVIYPRRELLSWLTALGIDMADTYELLDQVKSS